MLAVLTALAVIVAVMTVSKIALGSAREPAILAYRVVSRPLPKPLVPDPERETVTVVRQRAPKVTPPPPPPPVIEDHESNTPDVAPVPKPAAVPMRGAYMGPEIEDYARYEGQKTCDPSPKAGTVKLRNLLLAHYPATTSFGIDRACDVGGRSEHKEGRAFDWGANINNAAQRAAAEDFLERLFATDKYGNKDAMARRLGVMYVIRNKKIWHAHSAEWQPYEGTSPHTDHVHISLSWAGARAQTSFWSGKVVVEKRPDDDHGHHHHNPWEPPTPSPKPTVKPLPTPTLPPVLTPSPPAQPTATPSPSPSPSP